MQHQPTPATIPGSQVYAMPYGQGQRKQVYDNPADDPDYEPERHWFGYICAVLIVCCSIYIAYVRLVEFQPLIVELQFQHLVLSFSLASLCISPLFYIYFYFMALYDPKYCGGKPDYKKAWPLLVGTTFFEISCVILIAVGGFNFDLIVEMAWGLIYLGISYAIFFQDDSKNGSCLCLKPWGYVKKQGVAGQAPHHPGQYPIYGQAPHHHPGQYKNRGQAPLQQYQNYGQAPLQPGQYQSHAQAPHHPPGQNIPSVNPQAPFASAQPPPYAPGRIGQSPGAP